MKENQDKKQPASILVVDDEPSILLTLKKRLVSWNYHVLTAGGGAQAMELIHAGAPDLLITDLFMPEINGFDLMRPVRDMLPDLPIIVLSGQGRMHDAIQALRLGAWDFINKPIEEMSLLRMAIEKALEKARLIEENRTYRDHLEDQVARKSAALLDQQQILMEKTVSLERSNEALKGLLDQREIEKQAIEQTMVANLKRFVFPYLAELDQLPIERDARAYVDIIRTNIEQLIAPVSKNLSGVYRELTPMEVKVADLIRQGQSSKSIAALLATSPSTVEKHRNSIRRKLDLVNKKTNLQTYLNSLA